VGTRVRGEKAGLRGTWIGEGEGLNKRRLLLSAGVTEYFILLPWDHLGAM
jgi:hypothetical protein